MGYLPLTDLPILILTEPTVSLERTTKVVVSSDLRSQEPRKRPKRQKVLAETTKVEPASVVPPRREPREANATAPDAGFARASFTKKETTTDDKKEGDGKRRPAGAQASAGSGFGFRNTNAGASRGGPRGGGGDGGSRGRGKRLYEAK